MSSGLGHVGSSSLVSPPLKRGSSIADLVHPRSPSDTVHPNPMTLSNSNALRGHPYSIQQVIHPPMPTSVSQPPFPIGPQGMGRQNSTTTYPCLSASSTSNSSFNPPPRLMRPVPTKHQANYGLFPTAFLTSMEIEAHWDDSPIVINQAIISSSAPEDEFSEAIERVWVNASFRDRVRRTSVINYLGRNNSNYKYFATYSHLMDEKDAYIRIIAYHRSGWRVEGSDSSFGNRILVIPRCFNDVRFPSQLRFYALTATDDGKYPHEEHHDIIDAARRAMSMFDKVAWEHIHHTFRHSCQ